MMSMIAQPRGGGGSGPALRLAMNERRAKSAETACTMDRTSPISAGMIVAHIGAQTATQLWSSSWQPLSGVSVDETCIIVARAQLTAAMAEPAGNSVTKTSAKAANKLRSMLGWLGERPESCQSIAAIKRMQMRHGCRAAGGSGSLRHPRADRRQRTLGEPVRPI